MLKCLPSMKSLKRKAKSRTDISVKDGGIFCRPFLMRNYLKAFSYQLYEIVLKL